MGCEKNGIHANLCLVWIRRDSIEFQILTASGGRAYRYE